MNCWRPTKNPSPTWKRPANHIGDISVYKGEYLCRGRVVFGTDAVRDIQIAVYDAETLLYKKSINWEPESGQVEVSALAVDAVQRFWCG